MRCLRELVELINYSDPVRKCNIMNIDETFSRYVLRTYGRFPMIPVKGEGSYLWDDTGKKYLDFCTGIAVCSLGHCHPRLVQAITDQAQQLIHCSNLYQIPQQAELAKLITERCVKLPGKMFFSNSGAEANDGLIKLARRFGNVRVNANGEARYEVISFNKSFHGRTLGGIAATGQRKIKEGFEPLLPGFIHTPFNDSAALKAAVGEHTVAILLEPLQGEGGITSVTQDFLKTIHELKEKHDLLILFDEVQSGFGRLGDMMAWKKFAPDLEPDGISWAKTMGGGFPIGGFWVADRFIDDNTTPLFTVMGPGSHGSTYGGNPLACAAATAVLSEILEKDLPANAIRQEERIRAAIADWKFSTLKELRGHGLMLGWQLKSDAITVPEGQTPALHLVLKLMEKGLLTVPAGPDVVRWLPALNVTDEEIDQGLEIMRSTFASLEN